MGRRWFWTRYAGKTSGNANVLRDSLGVKWLDNDAAAPSRANATRRERGGLAVRSCASEARDGAWGTRRVASAVARRGQSPNITHIMPLILLEGRDPFEYEMVKIEWVCCRNSNNLWTVPFPATERKEALRSLASR